MSQLYCGASRRDITPPAELLPRLVGLKQHRFAGVLDEIYVRAAVFTAGQDSLLFLGFDMTTAPCAKEILGKLTEATGIPEDHIFFYSIHTHAVPFNAIDMEERERQSEDTRIASEAYTQYLWHEAIGAAEEAMAARQPARMGWAFGESHVNVCRLQDYLYTDENGEPFTVCNLGADFAKSADPRLFTLRVETPAGEPILFMVNYPMHNVATIWNDLDGEGRMGVSGDIGGGVSRLLEAQYPGSVALWQSGAAGDLNPILLNEVILPDPVTGRTREIPVKGADFARNCLRIMTERHCADIRRTLMHVRCGVDDGDIAAAAEWSVTPGVDCIRHHGAPPEFIQGPEVPEHTVRLQMARIGGLHICGVGAELYSSIGQAMLEEIPGDALLITHNMSALCQSHYILDDETIARCDASRGFAMVPGYDEYRCMAGVMKDDLCGHVRNLIEKTK